MLTKKPCHPDQLQPEHHTAGLPRIGHEEEIAKRAAEDRDAAVAEDASAETK